MAFVLADRVRETTVTTGTGAVVLQGPYSGFQSFSVIGDGNTTYYAIVDPTTSAWEIGVGTYTAASSTLSRDTVFSSSTGGLVDFAAGIKDVILTQPAERAVLRDPDGVLFVDRPQTSFINLISSFRTPYGAIDDAAYGFVSESYRGAQTEWYGRDDAGNFITGGYVGADNSGVGVFMGSYNSEPLTFWPGSVEKMRLLPSGDLLIGNTTRPWGDAWLSIALGGNGKQGDITLRRADNSYGAEIYAVNSYPSYGAGGEFDIVGAGGAWLGGVWAYDFAPSGQAPAAVFFSKPLTLRSSEIANVTAGAYASVDLTPGASGNISFSTNATEKMRLTANGDLIVGGTTAPWAPSYLSMIVGGSGKHGYLSARRDTGIPGATLYTWSGAPGAYGPGNMLDFNGPVSGYLGGVLSYDDDPVRSGVVEFINKLELYAYTSSFTQPSNITLTPGASGNITFKTVDVERMRVHASGNVSIGNTADAYKLNVTGDINFTGTLYQNGVPYGGGGGSGDVVGPASATNNSLALFDGTTGKLLKSAGGGFTVDTNGFLGIGIGASVPYPLDSLSALRVGGAQRGVITTTYQGNAAAVESWSSSFGAYLDFYGNTSVDSEEYGPLHGRVFARNTGQKGLVLSSGWSDYEATDPLPLIFQTNATEKMRITPNGNVGVGNSAPAYKLDVTGDINFTGTIYQNGVPFGGGSGGGDVYGPASSVADSFALFSGTSGKVLKSEGILTSLFTGGDQAVVLSPPASASQVYVAYQVNTQGSVSGWVSGYRIPGVTDTFGLDGHYTNTSVYVAAYGSSPISLSTGNGGANYSTTERMRITAVDGNVLVGSTQDYGYRMMAKAAATTGNAAFGLVVEGADAQLSTLGLSGYFDNTGCPTIISSYDGTGSYLPLSFYVGNAERVRISTAGNLGVGTNNPTDSNGWGRAIDVRGPTGAALYLRTDGSPNYAEVGNYGTDTYLTNSGPGANALIFWNGASERMRIDSAGNVGIGVVPSAWGTNFGIKALDIGERGALVGSNSDVVLFLNSYWDGVNFRYKVSGTASYFQQQLGAFKWFTAPSGTAGSAISFTQAMTLDESSNLLVGTTALAYGTSGRTNIAVNGTNTSFVEFQTGGVGRGYLAAGAANMELGAAGYVAFAANGAERARIHASGGFSLGNTVDPGAGNLSVTGRGIFAAGTFTTSSPVLDLSQTWNAAGVTFTGLDFNVTDTASAAASLLMDLRVGGTSRFGIRKDGRASITTTEASGVGLVITGPSNVAATISSNSPFRPGSISLGTDIGSALGVTTSLAFGSSVGFRTTSSGVLSWSSLGTIAGLNPADLVLLRDAAQTLAQRNGTNAQTFRVYNTFTDASNYERGKVEWASNVLRIGTENAGTGSARALELQTNGVTRLTVGTTGLVSLSASGAATGNEQLSVARIIQAGEGFRVGNGYQVAWSNGADYGRGIGVNSAGGLAITNGSTGGQSLEFREITAPASPATNAVRIYAEDNGSGATRLMALFSTGSAQQIISETGSIAVTGTISDSIGNVRDIPQNAQSGAGSYTLVASDAGKHVYITGTGGVTMPVSVFTPGQAITIVNNTASSVTITGPSAGTMYLAGTSTTGNRTLAQRGMCTAMYVVGGATPTIIISGAGLT